MKKKTTFLLIPAVLSLSFLFYKYVYLLDHGCIQVVVTAEHRISGNTKIFGDPCSVPFWYKKVQDYPR